MRTARTTIISAALALAGCGAFADPLMLDPPASISAPSLRPFADGVNWVLERDLVFRYPGQPEIRVPAGFVTDLASVPAAAQSLRSRVGTYSRAAILHDWLYWSGACSSDEADRIFYRAMLSSGSSPAVARQVYLAVHGFGKTAFEANRKERESGLPRLVPTARLPLLDDLGWRGPDGVRERLGRGPRPPDPVRPSWCDLGLKILPHA